LPARAKVQTFFAPANCTHLPDRPERIDRGALATILGCVNEWDDDNLTDEGPLECDLEELGGDDGHETAPCPNCGTEIYDDSPRCPVCGEYIVATVGAAHPLTWWWMLIAAVALFAFVCYILT
jgi:hypothetical protein